MQSSCYFVDIRSYKLNIFKKMEVSVKVIRDLICDLPITANLHQYL